ncbi:MAG TPA: hypothetical protein VF730_02375 [Terracidiphilus sp.]
MASPQQRPDPDESRREYREYEDLQRARMERRSAAGAGFAWWWVFWVVIIGLAIWWAGWGWGGTGGWWWSGRARTAPMYGTTSAAPGTNNGTAMNGTAGNANTGYGGQAAISGPGVSALTATNKQPYIGKPFQVSNVPVQDKVSDQVLWIGGNNSPSMLVVLAGNGNSAANAHIGSGDIVNVTGTVQKAPPQAQAKQQWSLNDDDTAKLEHQGAYIQATQVHKVQR